MTFQSVSVGSQPPATLLVPKGNPSTIYNSDVTNTVMISDHAAFLINDQMTVPLGPGTSISFDGKTEVYALALTDDIVEIWVFPGSVTVNQSPQAPAQTPPNVFSASIGSGSTADVIGGTGFPNPKKLPIQLLFALISSVASSVIGGNSAFTAEDILMDTDGIQYAACEVGLPFVPDSTLLPEPVTGITVTNTAPVDLKAAVVAGGAKVQLANGGAGGTGADRRCSCTVVFYLVNA